MQVLERFHQGSPEKKTKCKEKSTMNEGLNEALLARRKSHKGLTEVRLRNKETHEGLMKVSRET